MKPVRGPLKEDEPLHGFPGVVRRQLILVTCLALMAVSVSGCLDQPSEPSGEEMQGNATSPPPDWQVGETWEFRIIGDNNTTIGHVELKVVAKGERVGQATAYRVEETYVTPGQDPASRTRISHYDATTLNEVWDVCGQNPNAGYCRGRLPELNLPLSGNKTWTYARGSSPITYHARVAAAPLTALPPAAAGAESAWRITHERLEFRGHRIELLYTDSAGFFVERTHYNSTGDIMERWVLKAHHVPSPS